MSSLLEAEAASHCGKLLMGLSWRQSSLRAAEQAEWILAGSQDLWFPFSFPSDSLTQISVSLELSFPIKPGGARELSNTLKGMSTRSAGSILCH